MMVILAIVGVVLILAGVVMIWLVIVEIVKRWRLDQ